MRLTSGRWLLIAAGVAMIVLPPAVAAHGLRISQPARLEPAAVGFSAPVDPDVGRGFALAMLVETRGCDDDVDVTLVAAGTAEYWRDHARLSAKDDRFHIALPSARAGDVDVSLGDSASDVTVPQDVRASGLSLVAGDLYQVTETSAGDLLLVEGRVRHWTATLAPIVARYRADWLERRGLGSCYLRLPALTGDLGVLSTQRARGFARPPGKSLNLSAEDVPVFSRRTGFRAIYNARLEIVHGATTVVAATGDVLIGESLPSPDASTHGSPTWSCRGRPATVGLLQAGHGERVPDLLLGSSPSRSAGVFSAGALKDGEAMNCSALAVIVQPGSAYQRDLALLVTGAIVSLGFTILIELFLRVRYTDEHG